MAVPYILGLLVVQICLLNANNGNAIRLDSTKRKNDTEGLNIESLFTQYQNDFNRQYHSDAEKALRFLHFKTNALRALELARQNPFADFSFNEMTDKDHASYLKLRTGFRKQRSTSPPIIKTRELPTTSALGLEIGGPVPASLDWRLKGAVNPVRNQLFCGSCWAFSVVATTESRWFIQNGSLPSLSEEMLVACNKDPAGPCEGAFPSQVVQDQIDQFEGVMSLGSTYPYASGLSYVPPCDMTLVTRGAVLTGQSHIDANEDLMLQWLIHHGPLSVGVDAQSLLTYNNGIITNNYADEINHAVVLVGYGTEPIPFWIVRNSWGQDWGEEGYFRIERGKDMLLVSEQVIAIEVLKQ